MKLSFLLWFFVPIVGLAEDPSAVAPKALFPNVTAVVNGATFQPGIVAGSWATILGTDLANGTVSLSSGDLAHGMLPPNLSSTGAVINGRTAFVSYVSPNQVNVLLPDDPSLGTVTVLVTTAFITSNIAFANKVAFAPGLFTFTPRYPVAAHNGDGSYAGPPNLLPGVTTTAAHPGEVIQLFGTGFGPTTPAIPAGTLFTMPAPLAQPLTATVGGVPATVAGYLVFPGVYQLNLTVPALPDGDAPVLLSIGGVSSQSGLMLSIAN